MRQSRETESPLDALTFELIGWELKQNTEERRAWMNDCGVATLLRFHLGPPSWTFDLTNIDGARKFYGNQCQENKGAMLELNILECKGLELLKGIFKYRSPAKDSLGMLYAGIIWLPFKQANFQINVESLESGTTGLRESAVMLLEGDQWPKSDAPPIKVSSGEDLFARMAKSPVVQLPSDDQKYDAKFPDHPLSKVRARLDEILDTMKLDQKASSVLKPFRLPNK